MRKYKEELVTRLQNDSKVATENGVDFIIKPIPEMEKISGMDPRMLKAAKEKNIAFEVNNSSLKPNTFREGAWDNVKVLLKYCKEYGVNIIMGSDAHICYDVGNFEYAEKIIEDNGFPKELVINYDENKILEFLNIK